MHVHILGICGTFMGSLALLARELGYTVSGSDANVYPPMSTQLEAAGIALMDGYAAANLEPRPDQVIVGNALSRGNPEIEALLNAGIGYVSGPQWLAEHVLPGRRVLAVAGTHGKTTTASLLAWLLSKKFKAWKKPHTVEKNIQTKKWQISGMKWKEQYKIITELN